MSLSVLIRFNVAERVPAMTERRARLVTDVRGKQTLEPREITRPRSGNERIEQAPLLGRTHGRAPSARHMLPRSGDELPRVGFFDPKDVRNLPVGIVEGLSKHVRRALGWRELLQQKQHRKVQRLAPLGPQARIGAGVDRLRQP